MITRDFWVFTPAVLLSKNLNSDHVLHPKFHYSIDSEGEFIMNIFILAAQRFIYDEDGVTTIEYVMLASAVVAAMVLVISGAGPILTAKLITIVNSI